MHTELHDQAEGGGGLDRRQVLRRALVGGAVITVGSAIVPVSSLLPAAWAQQIPEDDDINATAQGLELAAVEVYGRATKGGRLGGPAAETVRAFADHHRQHAAAVGALLAEDAQVTKPDAGLVEAFGPLVDGAADEAEVLGALRQLESAMAATHFAAVASAGQRTAGVIATIQPVEAEHATALGMALGRPNAETFPEFQTDDGAVSQ